MPALEPVKIDRVAILASILRRNALRREARLPLLNVLVLYRTEVAYQRSWALHHAYYPALRAEVIDHLTGERGSDFTRTRSGAWMVHVEATRLLRERFSNQRPQHKVRGSELNQLIREIAALASASPVLTDIVSPG